MLQDDLAKKYKYKRLPDDESFKVRQYYKQTLPDGLSLTGDKNFQIISKDGTVIANGYNRIVIGDYGAFIEMDKTQIIRGNITVKKGEEYRITDKKYADNVKYVWLTAKDNSDIKIYYQRKTVTYADYKPNQYYVSPFEIKL